MDRDDPARLKTKNSGIKALISISFPPAINFFLITIQIQYFLLWLRAVNIPTFYKMHVHRFELILAELFLDLQIHGFHRAYVVFQCINGIY